MESVHSPGLDLQMQVRYYLLDQKTLGRCLNIGYKSRMQCFAKSSQNLSRDCKNIHIIQQQLYRVTLLMPDFIVDFVNCVALRII